MSNNCTDSSPDIIDTLDRLKKDKKEIENAICSLICAFEKRNNIHASHITVRSISPPNPCEKDRVSGVNISIEI